jgi:hypothetical protein
LLKTETVEYCPDFKPKVKTKDSHNTKRDDKTMKLSITLVNSSSHNIGTGDFQVRAYGQTPINLPAGFGPPQGLGYGIVWTPSDSLDAGQELKIECDTYAAENFILLDASCGANIEGGDNMGNACKLDVKHRDRVVLVDA